jgi:hypothetical protein
LDYFVFFVGRIFKKLYGFQLPDTALLPDENSGINRQGVARNTIGVVAYRAHDAAIGRAHRQQRIGQDNPSHLI